LKDYKPLTKETMETIWMYRDHLLRLDLFGDGDPSIPQRLMNVPDSTVFARSRQRKG
jgi:hypothetical protein